MGAVRRERADFRPRSIQHSAELVPTRRDMHNIITGDWK